MGELQRGYRTIPSTYLPLQTCFFLQITWAYCRQCFFGFQEGLSEEMEHKKQIAAHPPQHSSTFPTLPQTSMSTMLAVWWWQIGQRS